MSDAAAVIRNSKEGDIIMRRMLALFCLLSICIALFCGCTQVGTVAPQEPEKNPEAWLLQQSRGLVEKMTTLNSGFLLQISEEEREAFESMKEGLFDHPTAELYLYHNYTPFLDSLRDEDMENFSWNSYEYDKSVETDPMLLPNLLLSMSSDHLSVVASFSTTISGFLDVPSFLRGNAALLLWHGSNSTAVITFADRGVSLEYQGCLLQKWSEYSDIKALDKLPKEGMRSYDAEALDGLLKQEASVPHVVSVSPAKSAEEYYQSCVDQLLYYVTDRQNVFTKAYLSGDEDLQAAVRITGEPVRITLYEDVDDRGVSNMILSSYGSDAIRTFNVTYSRCVETCPIAAKNAVAFLEYPDGRSAIMQLFQNDYCTVLAFHPLPAEAAGELEQRLSGMAANTAELH